LEEARRVAAALDIDLEPVISQAKTEEEIWAAFDRVMEEELERRGVIRWTGEYQRGQKLWVWAEPAEEDRE
jgi:hypothetical protein